MQIWKLAGFISLFLFSGCAAIHTSKTPVLTSETPVAPVSVIQSLLQPVPIEWDNSDIGDWTDQKFPKPGDAVEILRRAGDYVSGRVLKSTAQTEQNVTTVLLILDTDGNHKADEKAKLIIEDKKDSVEIKMVFSRVKEE